MKKISGVIFDLDGTILDSLYVWNKVDKNFFRKRGMEVPKDYALKINSMSFAEAASFTKNEYGIKESIEEIMEQWHNDAVYEYSTNVKLKKYVYEYIKMLKSKGIKIGLATASPKQLYEPALKNNGVYDYFDAFTCGDEVSTSKEFPEIYLLTAQKLNISPSECIVFEDICKGIKGAKKAGMIAIGVYEKYSEFDKENIIKLADGYIKDFKQMLDFNL